MRQEDILDTDWDERLDLVTLEGTAEILLDKIQDMGVFELGEGESLTFGTYDNTFTVVEERTVQEDPDDDSWHWREKLIRCQFYENDEEIYLVQRAVIADGDLADFQFYWFDEDGNKTPEDNINYGDILENMDIFVDELGMDD